MVLRRLFHAEPDPIRLEAGQPAAPPPENVETESIRRIAAELEALPLEQRRFVAGFAYVLARAAHADLDVSERRDRATWSSAVVEVGRLVRGAGRARRRDGSQHERALRSHRRLRRHPRVGGRGRPDSSARTSCARPSPWGPPTTPSAPRRWPSSTRSARSWASVPTRWTPSATSSATSSRPSRPCAPRAGRRLGRSRCLLRRKRASPCCPDRPARTNDS